MKKKRGQIWVETVIYTLIAFALIGLVLAFVKPKIEEIRDKSLIEQSIEVLENIEEVIKEMDIAGNQRVIELGISKGVLTIDGGNDKIFFKLESKYEYSQPGQSINVGNVVALTEEKGKTHDVTLTIDYSEAYDIQFKNLDQIKEISKASTPYQIIISNIGEAQSKTTINIDIN